MLVRRDGTTAINFALLVMTVHPFVRVRLAMFWLQMGLPATVRNQLNFKLAESVQSVVFPCALSTDKGVTTKSYLPTVSCLINKDNSAITYLILCE